MATEVQTASKREPATVAKFFGDTVRYYHLPIPAEGLVDARAAIVTLAIVKIGEDQGMRILAWGAACCSPTEQMFSRPRGRAIAKHRLDNVIAGGRRSNEEPPRLQGKIVVSWDDPVPAVVELLIKRVQASSNAPRWLQAD